MTRTMLMAVVLPMLLGAHTSPAADRAIWAWEQVSYAMVQDRAAGDAATAFLKSKRIRTQRLHPGGREWGKCGTTGVAISTASTLLAQDRWAVRPDQLAG
jgi:hypothetical protein